MDNQDLERYSRQINLQGFGYDAQKTLAQSHVLVLGAGGLGSPAATYLIAAGVGTLTLIDPDIVERSNLARQIAHREQSIGESKVDSAKRYLNTINPKAAIHAIQQPFDLECEALVQAADVVVDCTDNFESRHAANQLCWQTGTPLVSGAAIRFEGQLMVVDPREADSPCYACLHPNNGQTRAESCSADGILSPVVGLVGVAQALEAIKVLTGTGQPLVGQLMLFDAMSHEWNKLKLPKRANCEVCS